MVPRRSSILPPATFSVILVGTMNVRRLGHELFRPRPKASYVGYIPISLVILFFGLMGLEDGGLMGALLPYGLLFLLAIVQLKFRTLLGWILLLTASLWYALEVVIHPEAVYGHYGEYAFFLSCLWSGACGIPFLLSSAVEGRAKLNSLAVPQSAAFAIPSLLHGSVAAPALLIPRPGIHALS
jgi:hypothetical protein